MLTRFVGIAAMLVISAPVLSQKVHSIRLRHPDSEVYRFEPARITARPGDRLEFVVEGGGPYVIGFEPADLTPRDRALVDAAMPDRSAPLRSPLLPRAGSRFVFVVPALPSGNYRFGAVTHVAYQMSGVLVVP